MTEAKLITWVPWRHRTSEADESAFLERRKPCTDRQLVASLLGEAPEEEFFASVPSSGPLEPAIRRFCELLANALALLDACHLLQAAGEVHQLSHSAAHRQVAALSRVDRGDGGGPLHMVGDCCMHCREIMAGRSRMRLLNSLWFALTCILLWRPGSRPISRLRHHKVPNAKQTLSQAANTTFQTDIPQRGEQGQSVGFQLASNWVRQVGGVGACIRFHTGRCKNKSCRFSHKCPVIMANGQLCGAEHAASSHASTQH